MKNNRTYENRLSSLVKGECAIIDKILESSIKNRLFELGFRSGVQVECVGRSPAGKMGAYLVGGAVIAIRDRDGESVVLKGGECLGE